VFLGKTNASYNGYSRNGLCVSARGMGWFLQRIEDSSINVI